MAVFLTVVGVVVVVAAIMDLLSTTLSVANVNSALSGHLADRLWRALVRLRPSHRALRLAGPAFTAGLVVAWVLLLWLGWSLIFVAAGDGIVESASGASASFGQRVYYAGYLVSTLGNGDIVAATPGWRIATVLASLNGLLALTLAITFLVPVVSAVVQRRALAAQIAGLGGSPERVLQRAWDGRDFSALEQHLTSLVPELHRLTQRQLAYPVLHYFHSTERYAAIAPLVAGLDEALLVIEAGAGQRGLSDVTVQSTRAAIGHLLSLVGQAYVVPAASPPPPDLAWCRRLGVEVDDVDAFLAAVDRERRRRQLLRGFVESDGWQWKDVVSSPEPAPPL